MTSYQPGSESTRQAPLSRPPRTRTRERAQRVGKSAANRRDVARTYSCSLEGGPLWQHEAMPPDSLLGPIEPLLDVARAAHFLGISVKTLRDWIQARRIDYVKVGARVMIRPETIRQFVTSNTRRAAG